MPLEGNRRPSERRWSRRALSLRPPRSTTVAEADRRSERSSTADTAWYVPAVIRTGRCLCGDVRYEFSGDPIAVVVCHCKHCQRQGGGAFSLNLIGLESQLSVDGTLQNYQETGENDDGVYVNRRFCGSCGSPIVSELLQTEGVIALKVGTLDDRSDITPAVEVWCVDKQPWVDLADIAVSMDRE